MAANELEIRIRGDVSDFTAKIAAVRTETDRTSKVIRTAFTSWGEGFEATSRYADGLAKRMAFIRQETERATEAQRRFNVEQRGGGATFQQAGPLAGLGGSRDLTRGAVGGAVGGAAGAAIAGGVAGLVISGIGFGVDFLKESARAYTEASRSAAFFESQVKSANLSLDEQSRKLQALRGQFNLTGNDARQFYGRSLLIAGGLGRPGDASALLRGALSASIATGQGQEGADAILNAVQSGRTIALKRAGIDTDRLLSDYAAARGVRASELTGEERRSVYERGVIAQGDLQTDAVGAYRSSAKGFSDLLYAGYAEGKARVGRWIGDTFTTLPGLALGTLAIPFREAGQQFGAAGAQAGISFQSAPPGAYRTYSGGLRGEGLPFAGIDGAQQGLGTAKVIAEAATTVHDALARGADYLLARAKASADALDAAAGKALDIRRDAYNRETPTRERLNLLLAGENPLAQIRERTRQEQDRIYTEENTRYNNALREAQTRLQNARSPEEIAAARARLDDVNSPAARRESLLSRDRELDYARRAGDIETERTARDIHERLDKTLSDLGARYEGTRNPVVAIMRAGVDETARLAREIERLGPAFAAQAGQIATGQARVLNVNALEGIGGQIGAIANTEALGARFAPRYTPAGFKLGQYGQQTDELTYTTSYGRTPGETFDKLFETGTKLAQTATALLPSGLFSGAERNDIAGRLARTYEIGGLGQFRPEDLTATQLERAQQLTREVAADQLRTLVDSLVEFRTMNKQLAAIAGHTSQAANEDQRVPESTVIVINEVPGTKASLGTVTGGGPAAPAAPTITPSGYIGVDGQSYEF